MTENRPNDQVKWYYNKNLRNSTPSDLKINADMKQETTRTGRKASIADTLLTKADPLDLTMPDPKLNPCILWGAPPIDINGCTTLGRLVGRLVSK